MDSYRNGLIKKTLRQGLTQSEQSEVDALLTEDAAFRIALQVSLRQQQVEGEASKKEGLRAHLTSRAQSLRRQHPATYAPPPWYKRLPVRRQLLAAATVALLMFLGAGWHGNQRYSDKALVAQYYQPLLSQTSAGLPITDKIFKEAKRLYFLPDYPKAASYLLKIPATDQVNYSKAQTLYAYTLFRQELYESAIRQFDKVLAAGAPGGTVIGGTEDNLRWTRMLAYLANGQADSQTFRSELAYFRRNRNQSYQRPAEALYEQLSSNWRKLVF